MNNLQLALKELDEEWFASLPAFEDKPPFEVSKEFLKWEQRVIYGKKSVANKVVKVILIAAALLIIFSVVALSTTKGREFVMHFFKESAVYSLQTDHLNKVNSLVVNYLPEGFELSNVVEGKTVFEYQYFHEDEYFYVRKHATKTTIDFDYNKDESERIEHDGIAYIVSYVDNNICNVIWNINNYYYYVYGNIDKETALQIAFGVN